MEMTMKMKMKMTAAPDGFLKAVRVGWMLALLSACGGGGGGGTPPPVVPGDPPPGGPPAPVAAAPLATGLYFDYTLERGGGEPIEEAGSVGLGCPGAGCPAEDLRELAGREGTGMRGGFATAAGTTGGPPLTRAFAGASATVSDAVFRRYGFWGEHGYAAVEIGAGDLSATAEGRTWSGTLLGLT